MTELFTGFGERGVSAELVGTGVANEDADYLGANVPVGRYLAEQLLLPMALGGGGAFRTVKPSGHARTHVELLRSFLGSAIQVRDAGERAWVIEVPPRR